MQGPTWFKRAIIYELHVRAFRDSDASGSGDFPGLTERLSYLHDLGVTALWLLPFFPSPGRDDGYDVSDYTAIHPRYGSLDDFRRFLDACKQRGLRVITELVLNHTSDAHPWFQRARHSPPGSPWRDFYVWSDTPEKYAGTRIIFNDFEESNWTWDPVAQAYFWHRFYSHQPDLNFDSPHLRQALFGVADFWLGMGVDGLRLDAIPYLFEREGTNCENLPETHGFLRDLRRHIDSKYPDRLLLAEANQWPEDAAAYFGSGDECHMAFHFPLMPRLFMATRMEDSFPVINILEQTPPIPDGCQWATFLRNHDELTLEMVREDERDYMYRAYARDPAMRINRGIRRRLAPLLANDRRRIELLNALLLSIPGTPVLYYGDEIGMGDCPPLGDRNGVRTPMQWNAGLNAGFSEAEPEHLYLPLITEPQYDYRYLNVEAQEATTNSLLWWMRNIIGTRQRSEALEEGKLEFLYPDNRHVLAFIRRAETEAVLVVANLSRFAQAVRLRLAEFSGRTPVEMFGHVEFPRVGSSLYPLSLAPYGFYWFELRPAPIVPTAESTVREAAAKSTFTVQSLESVLSWEKRSTLASILLPVLKSANLHSPRAVTHAEVTDIVPLGDRSAAVAVEIMFAGGDPELQLIPLAMSEGTSASQAEEDLTEFAIATVQAEDGRTGVLRHGARHLTTSNILISAVSGEARIRGVKGELSGHCVGPFAEAMVRQDICLLAEPEANPQRNLSIRYGDLFILKLLRRLEPGPTPDIDVNRFLFEQAGFTHVAPAAGFLEYGIPGEEPMIAGVVHAYVQNQQNFWDVTIDALGLFLDRALALKKGPPKTFERPHDVPNAEPALAGDLIQTYLEDARLLGRRTAELHIALSSDHSEPAFAPEPFDSFYVRGEYHAMAGAARETAQLLRSRLRELPLDSRDDARAVLEQVPQIGHVLRRILDLRSPGLRLRIHGDLHLAQVLHTGDDLIFIDFEGDNSRPLRERTIKRSPLQDVAGLLRSFHYAATSARFRKVPGLARHERLPERIVAWAHFWYVCVGAAFLDEYLRLSTGRPFLPGDPEELRSLLDVFLLRKAVDEVNYELINRPEWVAVALRGLLDVVRQIPGTQG